MNLGVAALLSWVVTAVFGGGLLLMWAARASMPTRGDRPRYGRPPPYIPRQMVVAHVLLAVGGLATWAGALLVIDELAYATLPLLVVVALLGAGMFLRWLGSRRARRAALAISGAPSESRLPTLMVLCHGVLGVTTVVLVLLSYFRPSGF